MDYKDWLAYMSQRTGRDVSQDNENYDVEGYYNSLKFNPGNAGPYDPKTKEAHFVDTFKKPNHPTFSDESKYSVPVIQQGGHWTGDEDTGFKFAPSEHNIENMGPQNLQSYFNKVESPEALDLPKEARMSALRKLSGR